MIGLLTIVNARTFGNTVFRWLTIVSLLLVGFAVLAIPDRRAALAAAVFNAVMAVLFSLRQFRRVPAALLLAINIVIFFALPMSYIGMEGGAYDFVGRFTAPGLNSEYVDALPGAILRLLLGFLALAAGLMAGHVVTRSGTAARPGGRRHTPFLRLAVLAVIVAYLAALDNSAFFASIAQSSARVTAILPFIFLDHAFLVLFPLVVYRYSPEVRDLRCAAPQLTFLFVTALFVAVFLSATSKGAMLTLFWYLLAFPLAVAYRTGARIYWPTRTVVLFALASALPLYFSALIQRRAKLAGLDLPFAAIASQTISELRSSSGEIVIAIIDRISAAFQNYVMIDARFAGVYDFGYASDFGTYAAKSFANLIWLRTPFPEAYFPSSQLLASVLDKTPLVGYGDALTFWAQANTQPYTGFGVALILLGPWATLIALAVAGFLFAAAYNATPNFLVRGLLLFAMNASVSMFGVESAAQVCIHVGLVCIWMAVVLSAPRLRLGLSNHGLATTPQA